MEAIAFVLGFVVLGALALRFGQDSREGIHSQEHEFSAHGVTWTDLATDRRSRRSLVTSPNPNPRQTVPTLAFIEAALDAAGALTASPDAARLEDRARALTAEYWSDAVWTTGVVPEAAFRQVLAELAPALLDLSARTVERPIVAAEPVAPARSAITLDRAPAVPERTVGLDLIGSSATA